MTRLDPRRHAVRDDLVDAALAALVDAPAYAEGTPRRIALPSVGCFRHPADDAPLDTEFLYGEPVRVFEERDGWAWVQSAVDGYVGYVPEAALAPGIGTAAADPRRQRSGGRAPHTHVVAAPIALVFTAPSIKVPVERRLPLGARLLAEGVETAGNERFLRLDDGGFVLVQHARPAHEAASDWVDVAVTFLGAPYLFGGKTWTGIDCSALVQLALQTAGRDAPRDSDMQEAELGAAIDGSDGLVRGDLVFWRGHVGIMLDEARLLHANGHHMITAVEPLAAARARLGRIGLSPTAYRRL